MNTQPKVKRRLHIRQRSLASVCLSTEEGDEEGGVSCATEVGEETKIEVEDTGAVVESGPSEDVKDVDMEEEGAVQSTANVEK